MQVLYSDQSYANVRQQLNRRLAALIAVLVVLLGVFAYALAVRTEWLAMASATAAGCFAVFFWDLFCAPLSQYRRLVRSALTARHHDKELEFVRMEPDPSVVDGVPCRGMIFLGDPDKHGSREMLLYWDRELPLPELEAGRVFTIRYTGKNIIGIQSSGS